MQPAATTAVRPAPTAAGPAAVAPFSRGNGALGRLFRAAKDDEPCPECAKGLRRQVVEGAPFPQPGTVSNSTRVPVTSPTKPRLQPKLTVNQPGDRYEREADRVADQVMRTAEPALQRKCACGASSAAGGECTACAGKQVSLAPVPERAALRLQRSPETDTADDDLVVIDDDVADGDTQVVGLTGQPQSGPLGAVSELVGDVLGLAGSLFGGEAQAAEGGTAQAAEAKKPPPKWITRIDVDLSAQNLTLTWSDGTTSDPWTISSGKGRPCTKTDPCEKQTEKNCTPVGTFPVSGIGGANTANSHGDAMAWFVGIGIRGIGVHNSQVADGTPRSHGCVRVGSDGDAWSFAKLINKNVKEGQTLILITGKAPTKPWKPPKGCPVKKGKPREGSGKTVQRLASAQSPGTAAPLSVEQALSSPGESLPSGVLQFMEAGFGQDFSHVRIHVDSGAQQSAADVSARAYTVGSDIVFGRGEYDPSSSTGRRLLAHELTHVVQQTGTTPASAPGDAEVSKATPRVQRDLLDDAMSFATSTYSSVASAVGDAYDAAKSVASQTASEVADTVSSTVSTVSSAAQAAGSFVSSVGETVSTDPEKMRANLLAQVSSTRQRVQSADPDTIVADPEHAAALSQNLVRLNSALPTTSAILSTFLPSLAPIAEAIGGILEAIGAAILGAGAAEILVIAIIILAIIALILYLFKGPMPVMKPQTKPTTEPKDKPAPEAKPGPKPGPVDPFPITRCAPTGYTPADPIPMTWFKPRIDGYYPREIVLGGVAYDRDDAPTNLPGGEPIGVEEQYWPFVGKVFQLIPDVRGPGADRFRAVLERYGFDWTGLQADHVQDIEFEGPDDSGFVNFWPMDASANQSAGATTNGQRIQVCLGGPTDPAPVSGSLRQLKSLLYGRYFVIRDIVISPPQR
jgi:hypothetical protein